MSRHYEGSPPERAAQLATQFGLTEETDVIVELMAMSDERSDDQGWFTLPEPTAAQREVIEKLAHFGLAEAHLAGSVPVLQLRFTGVAATR